MGWAQEDVPLVGRESELAVLRAAVAGAAAGSPGGVLVAGEAGGGKTRLVRALLEAPPPGALVLRAQCVDLGDPGLPGLALVDLVRAVQASADDDPEVAAVLDRTPVVASLTHPGGAVDASADEASRLRLFDATASLLAGVGRVRSPVVVTVEDLQWVDASSADFLRFLLSRVTSQRLAVVATVRTDGLAGRPRVRRLVSELGRLPLVHRLDLAPFDATEVGEYLTRAAGGPVDPGVVGQVLRRTGGNPYYVQTLAAGVARTGTLEPGVPRALADVLVGRLDGLPDDVRTLVRCAAVAARPVSDRLLRQVARRVDPELDGATLDAAERVAVAEGLLRPEGAFLEVGHDLLRDAVYQDLLPGERVGLHSVLAAALEAGVAGPVPAAEIAHHVAEAQDASGVVRWSLRAADEAMRVPAPQEALTHVERALAAWPAVDGAAELAEESHGRLAVRAARVAGLAGEPMRGLEWARRAVGLCDDDGDVLGSLQARAELVRRLLAVDATDQVVRPAAEAVRLAETAGLDEHAMALAQVLLARALLSARRVEEARPQAVRALLAARAAGEPGLEVEALTTTAFLDEIAGDLEAAADGLGTALLLARAEGELAAELRAHYTLASLHYYHGDVRGALPVLRTAMGRVTESGLRWSDSGVELRVLYAIARYVSGDLAGSLETAQATESRPPDVAAARLAAVSCYAAVARGMPEAEGRLAGLRESWDADPQVGLVAGGCEADRLTWEGDQATAVEVVERAQSHLDRVAGEGSYGGLWLSALGLAALADRAAYCRQRRDEVGTAAALAHGEELRRRVEGVIAGGHGRPGDLGPEGRAWHARAVAEHARLRGEPAVEQWQEALAAYGYGHVYEQARCHWRLAEALVVAGDRAAALTHAQAAAAAAQQMEAVPLKHAVALTVSQARLVGPPAGEGGLTRRELEVLALVAEGLTNREVGRRLFISEKTASVHLSNLMAKLNVSSRTEAVTVAQRRGLLDVTGPAPPPR